MFSFEFENIVFKNLVNGCAMPLGKIFQRGHLSQTMSELCGVHVAMPFLSEGKGNTGQEKGGKFAA